MVRRFAGTLVFFVSLACTPTVTIPVLDSFPERLLRVIGGHRHLTVEFKPQSNYDAKAFFAKLSAEVRLRRYYLSVHRREDAGNAPGNLVLEGGPGQARAVELLLSIDFPRKPDYTCHTYTTTETYTVCVKYEKKPGSSHSECTKEETRVRTVYHAVDTFTLWSVASLVSVETSRSLGIANTSPVMRSRQSYSPISCLGYGAMADIAEQNIAVILAGKMSPSIRDYRVPLLDGTDEVAPAVQRSVEDLLTQGIRLFPANPEQAVTAWQEALRLSDQRSASASWNLAVYCWAVRKLNEAQSYFDAAMAAGGLDWMTGRQRKAFNTFYREKKLVEKYQIEGL